MRIKILSESAAEGCRCGSWLEHWNTFSRQKANFCMVMGCDAKPEVGAHVQKVGETEDRTYIVPLCRACAAKEGEELNIVGSVNLVSAHTEQTCARKQASGY